MKRIIILALFVLGSQSIKAQVGINTTNPNSILDIEASNSTSPSNQDGILIPRIDDFPSVNPTANQDGMMVFLNIDIAGYTRGFYYWDHINTDWIFLSTGGKNTLDEAYDEGGLGAGKSITADNGAVSVNGNDGFLVTGTFNSGSTIDTEVTGAGTRMFFNPRKAAFRAGTINGTQWNNTNIGNNSAAFGLNNIASGNQSVAFGQNNITNGSQAAVFGNSNTSNGLSTVVFGENNNASGAFNFIAGTSNSTSGENSTAIGQNLTVGGDLSLSFGESNIVNNGNGIAIGSGLQTFSRYETALGSNNTSYVPINNTTFNSSDRLFVIGNGANPTSKSNALTIYKSGLMNINDEYNMPLTAGMANQVMAIDNIGQVSFVDASSIFTADGNSLNEAYNEGGSGTGKNISADNGSVRINGTDGFLVTGTIGVGNTIDSEITGAGSRMFFNPRRSAFRAGAIDGNQWNHVNIGNYSIAMGEGPIASNSFAIALGRDPVASGASSVALGWESTASGTSANAMNYQANAAGDYSLSFGRESTATGDYATSIGYLAEASNLNSVAIGNSANSSGIFSVAIGNFTSASGLRALATGYQNNALGDYSTAMGRNTIAYSGYETVIGIYSTQYTPIAPNGFSTNDRIFAIGNGVNGSSRSNALTIYKNGLMNINDEYNLPLSDGISNQIMATNGSGQVSFVNASSLFTDSDDQTLSLSGTTLSIIDGNSINLSGISESSSASNGLTEFGDDIQLGGTLTQDTSINYGSFDTRLNLDGTGDFIIQDNGTGKFTVLDNGDTVLGGDLYWRDEATNGTVIGRFIDDTDDGLFQIYENGVISISLDSNGTSIFNEQGFDRDFRIESNNLNDMFYVDAGNNRIGVGTLAPSGTLNIESNSSGTVPQLLITENNATDGGRIEFNNTVETTNSWTLYGRSRNVAADSRFNLFHSTAGNVMIATGNGDVGIGTTPSYRLDVRDANAGDYVAQVYNTSVNANADGLKIRVGNTSAPTSSTTFIGFFDGSNNARGRIQGNGTGTTYNTISDERLKTNITTINKALETIEEMKPKIYEFKENLGTKEYGFIAQELQPIYPQAVTGSPDSNVETDPMMVDYGRLTPLLTAGIKELKAEVDALKSENAVLKAKLNKLEALEARLTALENKTVSSEEFDTAENN